MRRRCGRTLVMSQRASPRALRQRATPRGSRRSPVRFEGVAEGPLHAADIDPSRERAQRRYWAEADLPRRICLPGPLEGGGVEALRIDDHAGEGRALARRKGPEYGWTALWPAAQRARLFALRFLNHVARPSWNGRDEGLEGSPREALAARQGGRSAW